MTAATADSAQARIEAIDRRLQELKQDLFSPHPAAAPQIRPESLAEMARLESEKATLQALPPHGDLPNQQI